MKRSRQEYSGMCKTKWVHSPLETASISHIQKHLQGIKREKFTLPLLIVLNKLIAHRTNQGFFNVAVDPVKLLCRTYFDIIKEPMDLGLVKEKLITLQYASIDHCARDIRLVFQNACLFNPPQHPVHVASLILLNEFERDFTRFKTKLNDLATELDSHTCSNCLANVCRICDEKCIKLEPPMLLCNGGCGQRIRRNATYHAILVSKQNYCQKCFTSLPREIKYTVTLEESQQTVVKIVKKNEAIRQKYRDELTEPWVQCDYCEQWVHQMCALFKDQIPSDTAKNSSNTKYKCPLCTLDDRNQVNFATNLDIADNSSCDSPQVVDLKGECPDHESKLTIELPPLQKKYAYMSTHSPVIKKRTILKSLSKKLSSYLYDATQDGVTHGVELIRRSLEEPSNSMNRKTFLPKEPFNFKSSRSIPITELSEFMEKWIRNELVSQKHHEIANSVTVRLVSNISKTYDMPEHIQNCFDLQNERCPERAEYTSKAIFVFQEIEGIEICVFSMYTQEYSSTCQLKSNRNRVYLAYVDSLGYFRPRGIRSHLFHHILISYFAYCKLHAFHQIHIWACPSTRGGDFIYWCHPVYQRNPNRDRLLQWYHVVISKAMELGVVKSFTNLYSSHFRDLLQNQVVPPYFDGDYWQFEMERALDQAEKRNKKKSKTAHNTNHTVVSTGSTVCEPDSLYLPTLTNCMSQNPIQDMPRTSTKIWQQVCKSVESSKECLFVLNLQPECSKCSNVLVNVEYFQVENYNPKMESHECIVCKDCYQSLHDMQELHCELRKLPSFIQTYLNNTRDASIESNQVVSCDFLNNRTDLLKNCEEHHFQFDTFRRAKYSTMMLLEYILNL